MFLMVNGSGNEWFMAATMAMVRHTYHHLVHMFAMVYLTIVVFAIATTSNFMMQVVFAVATVVANGTIVISLSSISLVLPMPSPLSLLWLAPLPSFWLVPSQHKLKAVLLNVSSMTCVYIF